VAPTNHRLLATTGLVCLALLCPSVELAGASSPTPTQLAAGHQGSYTWTVKATGLVGSSPCVSVAITHHHGDPFSYDRSRFRECVLAAPGLSRSAPPLMVGGTHLGWDGSRMTIYGVLAAAPARRVRATLSDGVEVERVATSLQRVPVALTARRHMGLRFAVIALSGGHCVERLATESAFGGALWQGTPPELECGPA
jgi:hypothetical protein